MKLDKAVLGILLLALVPVAPQMLFGYGGHDFRQHVPSWMELRDLWRAGQLHTGWAPRANFTLGDPRFCYYPPVSFLLGAGLAMLLPFSLVPGTFVWMTFALCGLFMYYASGEFLAAEDRWKAAVLYMASPYLLTTALVRFAAAEVLTLAWLPLIFLCFYRSMWLKERRATIFLGCLLGLTWITNVPASIVLVYVLLSVAAVLAIMQRSLRPLVSLLLADCIAAALAAFYLAPTWLEQGWIHKDLVLRDKYELYFLFIPFSHLPLLLFGLALWLYACVSVALIVLCTWGGRRASESKTPARTWLLVTLVCFFFQLPLSAFLWKHLPELRFADFPYRFLAPIGVMAPLMLLARTTPRRWRIAGYIVFALMALLPIREYRAAKAALVNFKSIVPQWQTEGYRAWPEFVPAGATRPTDPMHFPAAEVVDPVANPLCSVRLDSEEDARKVLTAQAAAPCQIRVAQYFYPYWRAIDESGIPLPLAKDAYGLLLISVPTGKHTIQLTFRASSPARKISRLVSALTLVLVLLNLFGRRLGLPERLPLRAVH